MNSYGSLQNLMASNSAAPEEIKIGQGVTELLWTDRHAYTVIEIKTPKKIVVQRDKAIYKGKISRSECEGHEYEYERDPDGDKVTISLRKDGRWKRVGTDHNVFIIGIRKEYYDPHF